MNLNRIQEKAAAWAKEYWLRLNTGSRPSMQSHEIRAVVLREPRDRPLVHLLLFLATLVTTTMAVAGDGATLSELFLSGLPFSLTLVCILLSHEFGHYFAAKKFGANPTLPFFIPLPLMFPSPGTMGAVIRTRSPIPHRRALLYIGAMGPLPGFIVSLAAAIAGICMSDVRPLPAAGSDMMVWMLGDSLLLQLLTGIVHGTVPPGHYINVSPSALAAWYGFLITSLNLMPIGQLDGSHVLYALIGRKQRLIGWAFCAGLIVMSIIWWGWIVWVVMTFLFLMVAHPDIPEGDRLTVPERALGWFCMAILVLTFVPVPLKFS